MLKTASILKEFSTKIKQAQDGIPGIGGMGETLTPEAVQDIAMEIQQVAEVASELASEIAEGVPAEETTDVVSEEETETPQLEVAQDDSEDDDEKKKLHEQVANMSNELIRIKREATLQKLAPKFASLFHPSIQEAKLNEIINSKEPINIVEAKIQMATEIINSKPRIKVASMGSMYDIDSDDSEEVNFADKV